MNIEKEREEFEAVTSIYHCIYNADLNYYFSGSKFVGNKAEIEVNAGWKAWQAAKAQAVPEGFAVVPIEITPKQIEAYMKGKVFPASMGEHRKFVERLSKDYKAMIEAQEKNQ